MVDTNDTRRNFLTYSGAVGLTALAAGCLSSDDDGENGDDDDDGAEDNGGEDDTEELHPRYGYPSEGDEEEPVESDHTVKLLGEPPEFYFDPAGLAIEAGDVVRFEFDTPDHAVVSFHEAFGRTPRTPEYAEPVSSPMMEVGTYWLCEFDEPGVWDLYCPPHEFLSMGMRLVVDEATGPATEKAETDVDVPARPPEPELAATFNAEALEPETILEEGEVPWADVDLDLE